jgi:DNA-binding ferritin-like protein
MSENAPNAIVNALVAVHVALRVEELLFHVFHWRSKGADYYGDHLLYQRLYQDRAIEIDRIGEVLLALGGPGSVAPSTTIIGMQDLVARVEATPGPDAVRGLALVNETLRRINDANDLLGKTSYSLSVNNVLAGFADKHLEALYLLKQRSEKK